MYRYQTQAASSDKIECDDQHVYEETMKEVEPFVTRHIEDGTVYWRLHDETSDINSIQLTAISTSNLSQLELDAFKSFGMEKVIVFLMQ